MYGGTKLILGVIILAILGGGVYFVWPYLPIGDATKAVANLAPSRRNKAPDPARAQPAGRPKAAQNKYSRKLDFARKLLEKDPVKARNVVENILKDEQLERFSADWFEVTGLLSKINTVVLFSACPCEEKTRYTVQPGDNLTKIANRFDTTPAFLIRSNETIDPDKKLVYPRQTLWVYRGNWNIRISKEHYALLLYDADRLVKVYRVGLGKQNRTPEGRFRVAAGGKVKNPPWDPPGRHVPAGHPDNPLGTRWLALKGTEASTANLQGYGIHGTTDDSSITKNRSNGCIRMHNSEVEELFDIVTSGTPVIINP